MHWPWLLIVELWTVTLPRVRPFSTNTLRPRSFIPLSPSRRFVSQQYRPTSVNGDVKPLISHDDIDDEEDDDNDPSSTTYPICRVVTLGDGRLPVSLPQQLDRPTVVESLDRIYHALAHEETRRLRYMTDEDRGAEDRMAVRQVVEVTRASLEDAGFQLLGRRDLDLCEALNAGYLLRLSILPDLQDLDPHLAKEFYPELGNGTDLLFEGRVLVYWRGYSEEVSRGRLLLPKIDYLQASIVQRGAAAVKARLNVAERWVSFQVTRGTRQVKAWITSLTRRVLDQLPADKLRLLQSIQKRLLQAADQDGVAMTFMGNAQETLFKPWFKLQRYGGSKIRFVGSPDPTDALTPFVICEETEYCPSLISARDVYLEGLNAELPGRNVDRDMHECLRDGSVKCPYDQALYPGKTKTPPMQLLKRVSLSSLVNVFSSKGRRALFQTVFSPSELVEPTYEEVVVVWRPLPKKPKLPKPPVIRLPKFLYEIADMFDFQGLPDQPKGEPKPKVKPIEIRSFSGVPMANIPAVLPKTKLIFRPADALVFDFVSILSFLLVVSSQRFDSPKLDLLALVSVSLWVIRTLFRYSNKLARYDLLVKKFLTSKISHRNRGALKYIVTEGGSQRALRAALVHTWLTSRATDEDDLPDRSVLVRIGQGEINDLLDDCQQRRIDVDAALNDLEDLGLVTTTLTGHLQVMDDDDSVQRTLKKAWGSLFASTLSLRSIMGRRRR